MTEPKRTRTTTWQDPTASVQTGRELSGLKYLQELKEGILPAPPISVTMGMNIETVEEGRVVFSANPAEYHYNTIGTVHGGFAATLLDSAVGCAIHSTLPPGAFYTTLELKINYIKAMTSQTGTVYAEGKVISRGNRIATAEARLTDAAGKLYAFASTTCMIFNSEGSNS